MKKNILLIVAVFLTLSSFAQRNKNSTMTWFSLSAKGGYGTSLLFNKPTVDDANIQYAYYSPSYFVAGRFGLLFGDYVGASFEAGYNAFSQSYTLPNSFKRNFSATSFDYGFLLNFQSENGFYFDIGPKFSVMKTANLNSNSIDKDIMNKIASQYAKINLGIGFKPVMTQVFEMRIGIVGSYTLSSILSDNNYIIPIDDGTAYYPNPAYYDGTTHAVQLMLNIEFTHVFGRFGMANCGKYRFMINN